MDESGEISLNHRRQTGPGEPRRWGHGTFPVLSNPLTSAPSLLCCDLDNRRHGGQRFLAQVTFDLMAAVGPPDRRNLFFA